MPQLTRYNTAMVVLHWLLAVFILGALFMGLVVLDGMDNNHPRKILLLKLHIVAGVAILFFTLLRLVLRVYTRQPEPAPNLGAVQEKISKGVHHLLYLLTILTALSGMALAYAADLPGILLDQAGALPQNYDRFPAHEAHQVFANLLLLTIALHAAAALYHHFVLQDGLLSRMSIRRKE